MFVEVIDMRVYDDVVQFVDDKDGRQKIFLKWVKDNCKECLPIINQYKNSTELLDQVVNVLTDVNNYGCESNIIYSFLHDTNSESTHDYIVEEDYTSIQVTEVTFRFSGEDDLTDFFIQKLKEGTYNTERIMINITKHLLKE